jgi:hypothetical protein
MPDRHDDAVCRFTDACRTGDIAALRTTLDADVIAVCDTGGIPPQAAVGPCQGAEYVTELVTSLLCGQPDAELTIEAVNGRAGLALRRAGRAVAVVGVTAVDSKIAILWIVLNPAKLHRWDRR